MSAVRVDGLNWLKRNVKPSGRSTYRIIRADGCSDKQFEWHWKQLAEKGCSYEQGDFGFELFAVDVPKRASIQKVFQILESGEKLSIGDFEEGHIGHKVD